MSVVVCRFTSLDGLGAVKEQQPIEVLRALVAVGRYSVWDATKSHRIAKTITRLYDWGYLQRDQSLGFPWSKVVLTPKGEAAMAAGRIDPPKPAPFVCRVCGKKPGRHVIVHGEGESEEYTCAPCYLAASGGA